jgi:hypothetical protein
MLGNSRQHSCAGKKRKRRISAISALWHGGCKTNGKTTHTNWEANMINHKPAANSFWNSKLGQAAMASIAAMVMMIALSSQIQPGAVSAAPITHPASDTGTMSEIA